MLLQGSDELMENTLQLGHAIQKWHNNVIYTFIHLRKCIRNYYKSIPMLYIDALVIKRDQIPALIKLTVYYYLGWRKQRISNLQQGKSAHLFSGVSWKTEIVICFFWLGPSYFKHTQKKANKQQKNLIQNKNNHQNS